MRLASFIIGVLVLFCMDITVFDTTPWDVVCVLIYAAIPLLMILVPLFLEFFERRR